ncbi:MAG: AAA family ATPase [Nitriliruptoraceae bacterium]
MSDGLLGDEQLTGEVIGTYFSDPASGFGVIELETGSGEGVRCAGPLAGLIEGDAIRVEGRWTTHPRHGPTFEVLLYEQVVPSTVAGLRAFLEADRFEVVPPETRQRVLTTFGAATGRVLDREPDRLVTEAGLAPEDAEELQRAWRSGRALADLHRLVEPVRWPVDVVRSVHARFGAQAVELAEEDPYALLDAERARFAHVDALARHLGIGPTDPRRLTAGAQAAVTAARRRDGHEHLRRAECVAAAAHLLGVDRVLAVDGVDRAVAGGALVQEDLAGETIVTTPTAQRTEQRLAQDLAALLATDRSRLASRAALVPPGEELTEGQRAAVRTAFGAAVSVLTGGPGTGKTRTVEEVVLAAEAEDLTVALCAPTGRAAKRIEELVGRPASTIHRLLEARPDGGGGFTFRYGRDERLPFDLVVVDEVSMCDTWLASRLVASIDDGAHLLLVGDADQLPSVGPGDVLRDIVRSEVVPVTALTEIHRQAAGSRIVGLAREILSGTVDDLAAIDGDVFLAEERDRRRLVPRVVQAVAERVPEYFDVDTRDVQVLAPIYRGVAGVDALNDALGAALNPPGDRPEVAGFRVGDRVLQTRNDPILDVANGDVGTVVDLDSRMGQLRVGFPRGEVTLARADARNLAPAWAVTVHKAQGGEWPVVVLVLDASHRSMLWRNLVYTAVTRARRALIIVGQVEALRAAARQDRPRDRRTGLAQRLVRAAAGGSG